MDSTVAQKTINPHLYHRKLVTQTCSNLYSNPLLEPSHHIYVIPSKLTSPCLYSSFFHYILFFSPISLTMGGTLILWPLTFLIPQMNGPIWVYEHTNVTNLVVQIDFEVDRFGYSSISFKSIGLVLYLKVRLNRSNLPII